MVTNGNGDIKKTVQKTLLVEANTVIGSTYAQIVGVVVTDTDITLEFVYKSPRPDVDKAQVVARVTLPRKTGEGLSKTIMDTIQAHEHKKEKKNG